MSWKWSEEWRMVCISHVTTLRHFTQRLDIHGFLYPHEVLEPIHVNNQCCLWACLAQMITEVCHVYFTDKTLYFVIVGVRLLPPLLESLFFDSLENILFSLYSPYHVFLVSHSIRFDMREILSEGIKSFTSWH